MVRGKERGQASRISMEVDLLQDILEKRQLPTGGKGGLPKGLPKLPGKGKLGKLSKGKGKGKRGKRFDVDGEEDDVEILLERRA
jgi:hypothetical protein